MKILVINKFGKNEIKESDFVPSVGMKVDMFFEPIPTVTKVVCWPKDEILKQLKIEKLDIVAIVMVT